MRTTFLASDNTARNVGSMVDSSGDRACANVRNDAVLPKELDKRLASIIDSLDFRNEAIVLLLVLDIARHSVSKRSNVTFFTYLSNFVSFTSRLTKDSLMKVLRIYKDNSKDPDMAVYIANDFCTQLQDDNPEFVRENDIENEFLKSLEHGMEKVHNIRLMIVGMFFVGKTSLVNNLIEDFKTTHTIDSTEGINVHKCRIERYKWFLHTPTFKDRLKDVQLGEKPPTISSEYKENEHSIVHSSSVAGDDQPKTRLKQSSSLTALFREVDSFDKARRKIEKSADNKMPLENVGTTTLATVWDFGGQNIYYTTHHFFLNSRSIYLLLMDVSKPLDSVENDYTKMSGIFGKKFTGKDVFKFWLRSIHMYSTLNADESRSEGQAPIVVLIGTKKDQLLDMTDEEKEIYKEKFFDEALESFRGTPILSHIHRKKFLVNNLERDNPVYDEIKLTVQELASQQYYWNKRVPARWIELEKCMELKRKEGKEVMELRELQNENDKNVFAIKSVDELKSFLKTQHLLGNILYFDTDRLREHVILKPWWIIEAFKCFISHVKDKRPTQLEAWSDFEKMGILKPELMEQIMEQTGGHIRRNKTVVIRFLEHLDIFAQPVNRNFEGDQIVPVSAKYLDFHVVPCLLKKTLNEAAFNAYIGKHEPPEGTTAVLCFVFKEKFMPPSVFHRLLASAIHRWDIAKQVDNMLLFNGLGIFQLDNLMRLVLWYESHIIYCRVTVRSGTPSKALEERHSEIIFTRKLLETSLREILEIGPLNSCPPKCRPFELYIQCQCVCEHEQGLLRVKDFEHYTELNCDAKRCHVSREFALKHWFVGLQYKDTRQLDRSPTERELADLTHRISSNVDIYLFGVSLGISSARIEQLCRDSSTNNDLVFCLLKEWWKKRETIGNLRDAVINKSLSTEAFNEVFQLPTRLVIE